MIISLCTSRIPFVVSFVLSCQVADNIEAFQRSLMNVILASSSEEIELRTWINPHGLFSPQTKRATSISFHSWVCWVPYFIFLSVGLTYLHAPFFLAPRCVWFFCKFKSHVKWISLSHLWGGVDSRRTLTMVSSDADGMVEAVDFLSRSRSWTTFHTVSSLLVWIPVGHASHGLRGHEDWTVLREVSKDLRGLCAIFALNICQISM